MMEGGGGGWRTEIRNKQWTTGKTPGVWLWSWDLLLPATQTQKLLSFRGSGKLNQEITATVAKR